ncbi:hypothetical protein PHYPSEUDO_004369 [Phytophthora pseudosyringae]|uniref:DUSP domain-containing protein n=1 Tax=Phytophthora pseudosyringae TaxID=221518 RepID=A0A8T1VRR3_9STRA|nr:hypothetical protein PHYPSEUDO_004369 [Phytophthora pseudosyringae]
MEHLPEGLLAHLFSLLSARDVLQVASTCRSLSPSSPCVQLALERVVTRRFGAVTSFLPAASDHWPRSLAVLRGAEMLHIKELLARAAARSFEDAAACPPSCVVVSRAWLGAYKKRCQNFEQFLQQFRRTKRQQRRQNAAKKRDVFESESLKMAANSSLAEAGAMIVCAHDALLPAAQCVGRSRRAIVSGDVFREIAVYAPELRGFSLRSCSDCTTCVLEQEARELEAEEKKQARFDGEIAGSEEMLELLQRKNGYPKGLFSPVDSVGSRSQQLAPHLSVNGRSKYATYFLVPKKWLNKWRKFVRSQADDAPGPVLNAELVCLSHQRTIVPPYISMFLSGFTLEQSLKATQALGSTPARQYEIITFGEWEALYDRYCAEFAVGFDVINGAYHWRTQECQMCNYGMGGGPSSNQPNSRR